MPLKRYTVFCMDGKLTFTTIWANSAVDKLVIVFFIIFLLFYLEKRLWQFMQVFSKGDNLHEMSKPIF